MERFKGVNGRAIRIFYTALQHTSGLTDCTIDIYNDDGVSQVSAGAMTEIGSTGVYYYDYTPTTADKYLIYCNSVTAVRKEYQMLEVTDYGETASDVWKYDRDKRTVMGAGGGWIERIWDDNERKLIIDMAKGWAKMKGELKETKFELEKVKGSIVDMQKLLTKKNKESTDVLLTQIEGSMTLTKELVDKTIKDGQKGQDETIAEFILRNKENYDDVRENYKKLYEQVKGIEEFKDISFKNDDDINKKIVELKEKVDIILSEGENWSEILSDLEVKNEHTTKN